MVSNEDEDNYGQWRCKNCGHKLEKYPLIGRKDGQTFDWRHVWENDLGYCQAKNCSCDSPELKEPIKEKK